MRQQGRSTGHGTPVSSWLGTSYDAGEIPSVKQKILCQYVNFFRKLEEQSTQGGEVVGQGGGEGHVECDWQEPGLPASGVQH